MQILNIKKRYNRIENNQYGSKNIENSLAMLYNENSKLTKFESKKFEDRIKAFSTSKNASKSLSPYKCYPGNSIIDLSSYSNSIINNDFINCLSNRRSCRDFWENYKLSLNEIGTLLCNSYGVSSKVEVKSNNKDSYMGLRNVPSGGALFPLEIYLITFNSDIPPGAYHYRVDKNFLEIIKEGNFIDKLSDIVRGEPFVKVRKSSALIITTGVFERVYIKYGERGYRFMLQESGFVGMLISLIAESMKLGTCMLGGYLDDEMNDFLGIDGAFESINNIIVIGKHI